MIIKIRHTYYCSMYFVLMNAIVCTRVILLSLFTYVNTSYNELISAAS